MRLPFAATLVLLVLPAVAAAMTPGPSHAASRPQDLPLATQPLPHPAFDGVLDAVPASLLPAAEHAFARLAQVRAAASLPQALDPAAQFYGIILDDALPAPVLPSWGLAEVARHAHADGAALSAAGLDAPALAQYDALPTAQRDALGLLLAAFLRADELTAEAVRDGIAFRLAADGTPVNAAEAAGRVDHGKLLRAASLLARAADAALPALSPEALAQPSVRASLVTIAPVKVCGVVGLGIDLGGVNSAWGCTLRFLLDAGGDDRYTSHVGAAPIPLVCLYSNMTRNLDPNSGCNQHLLINGTTRVGFGLDVAGNDVYDSPIDYAAHIKGWGHASAFDGVGVLVDAAGNDRYIGGADDQACAAAGAALLADLGGDDHYTAGGQAQAGAVSSPAVLFDALGNDRYEIGGYGQGGANAGFGLLLDAHGDDTYVAGASAQGYGNANWATSLFQQPGGGEGILADLSGVDLYTGGAQVQGAGYLAGIGLLLDGVGDPLDPRDWVTGDTYRAGYIAQGVGRLGGVGVLLDASGNDRYAGGANVFNQNPGLAVQGYGLGGGSGLLLDPAGDDVYTNNRTKPIPWVELVYGVVAGALVDGLGSDLYNGVADASDLCAVNRLQVDVGMPNVVCAPVETG